MLNVTGLGIHHGRAAKSWELRNQVPSPIGYWLSDRPFLSINNDMEVRLSWSEDFHFYCLQTVWSVVCMVCRLKILRTVCSRLYSLQTVCFGSCWSANNESRHNA